MTSSPASGPALLIGILVVLLALAGGGIGFMLLRQDATPPAVVVDSLDGWVELSRREGFTLLDKADREDYYLSVFRTGDGDLAVCWRWKGEGDAPDMSLALLDEAGQPVQDATRWEDVPALNPTGSLPGGAFVHGTVTPIREGYRGAVRIELKDNRGARDAIPARSVYATSVNIPAR